MSALSASNELLHTKDYFTDFSTNDYLDSYTYFETIPWFVKHLKELVRIFVHNGPRLGHDRALEFGGGPTLVSSFVLAQYVKSITFSEYVPSNLKAVEDWINRTPNAHDWTNVFNAIIEEYRQQTGTEISLSQSEENLRTALQHGGILRTEDVNKQGHCPVLDNQANYSQFDIVLCSFCLESACLTYDAYQTTIKRLYNMIKPGGFLLLAHARNQTFYSLNGKRFHALSLNEHLVREMLEKMNLVNIQLTFVERTPNMYSDTDGYFIACGNKME